MSTRGQISFNHGKQRYALIYVHCDMYPDGEHGGPARLQRFFKEVQKQTKDTRFNCAEYLAAKFVVWQAAQYAKDKNKPLEFLFLGVTTKEHGDIEFLYTVDCDKMDENGFPTVTW